MKKNSKIKKIISKVFNIYKNDGEIVFLRKVVEGSTSRSYGIQVAKMAGLPNAVVSRALTLINRIQKDCNCRPWAHRRIARKNHQKNL